MRKDMVKEVFMDLKSKGLFGNVDDGLLDLSKCCDLVVEEIKNNFGVSLDWDRVYDWLEEIELV